MATQAVLVPELVIQGNDGVERTVADGWLASLRVRHMAPVQPPPNG